MIQRIPIVAGILSRVAWAVFGLTLVFAFFHASDRDPLQWPCAIVATFSLFAAIMATAFSWFTEYWIDRKSPTSDEFEEPFESGQPR